MMQAKCIQPRSQTGFSLMELVTIIVLMGVLSITVISRFNINSFDAASFEQELRSAIRFAQKFAIASGCRVQVDVNAGTNSYSLSLSSSIDIDALPPPPSQACLGAGAPFGEPLPNPATGGAFAGSPQAGTVITDGETFIYNNQGIPVDPAGNPLAADGTIRVDGRDIVIEAMTGYVH